MLYLAVDNGNLVVTTKRDNAVVFTLKALNESTSRHNFEFSLTSKMTTFEQEYEKLLECPLGASRQTKKEDTNPQEMYLETDVNPLTGNGSNAPRMDSSPNFRKTRLLLKKRINHRVAGDTQQWRKGRDPFYISCIHRMSNGYLCVKKRERFCNDRQMGQPNRSGDMPLQRTHDATERSPTERCDIHSSQSLNGSTTHIIPTEGDATPARQPSVQRNTVGHVESNQYRICIKSSVNCHCEEEGVFMLFWLKPIVNYL